MDKDVSIVLSGESKNHRKLAQEWYGLTDEQMKDCDVHHNPARHKGGRNIPEHLFVYHYTLHNAVHGDDFTKWARKGYEERKRKGTENKRGVRTGGGNPRKTCPTDEELKILKLRQSGKTRKEVAELLGVTEGKVKRAVSECSKFGYKLRLKPGPKKGCKGTPQTSEAIQKIKEKRKDQVLSEESNKKRSKTMKKVCQEKSWSRRKKDGKPPSSTG
jgi:hypothetical protein